MLQMVASVVANDVDKGGLGTAGIMQVGNAIAQARAKMQQGSGGATCHASITISRARANALKQAENGPHLWHVVYGGHKVHFGCAGVGKTDVDTPVSEGLDEGLGSVHNCSKREIGDWRLLGV
jgi:hypothetical protein